MAKTIGKLSATMGLDASPFMVGMKKVQTTIQGFAGSVKTMAASASGVAFSPGGLIAGAAALFGGVAGYRAIMGDFERLESAKRRFFSLAGEQGGAEIIAAIRGVQAVGGPAIEDLQEMGQKYLAVGFSARDTAKMLAEFGSIVRIVGDPTKAFKALDRLGDYILQIKATGKVELGLFQNLSEFGLPVFEALAMRLSAVEGTAVTADQAIARLVAGTVTASDAVNALVQMGRTTSGAAALDAEAKSVKGLWASLVGELTLLFQDLGSEISDALNLREFFGSVTDWIVNLRVNFDSLRPTIQAIGTAFAVVRDVFFAVFSTATSFFTRMESGTEGTVGMIDGIRESMVGFFQAMLRGMTTLAISAIQTMAMFAGGAGGIGRSWWTNFRAGLAAVADTGALGLGGKAISWMGGGASDMKGRWEAEDAAAGPAADFAKMIASVQGMSDAMGTAMGEVGRTGGINLLAEFEKSLTHFGGGAKTLEDGLFPEDPAAVVTGFMEVFFGGIREQIIQGEITFGNFFRSIQSGSTSAIAKLSREFTLGSLSVEQFESSVATLRSEAIDALQQAMFAGRITVAEYGDQWDRLDKLFKSIKPPADIEMPFKDLEFPDWLKKITEGTSPLDVYLAKIEELNRLNSLDLLSPEQFGAGAAAAVKELEDAVGLLEELKNPGALISGTKEAFSQVLKIQNQGAGENAQQKIARLQARAIDLHEKQLAAQQMIAAGVLNQVPVMAAAF